jgi:hypothetical protein
MRADNGLATLLRWAGFATVVPDTGRILEAMCLAAVLLTYPAVIDVDARFATAVEGVDR